MRCASLPLLDSHRMPEDPEDPEANAAERRRKREERKAIAHEKRARREASCEASGWQPQPSPDRHAPWAPILKVMQAQLDAVMTEFQNSASERLNVVAVDVEAWEGEAKHPAEGGGDAC